MNQLWINPIIKSPEDSIVLCAITIRDHNINYETVIYSVCKYYPSSNTFGDDNEIFTLTNDGYQSIQFDCTMTIAGWMPIPKYSKNEQLPKPISNKFPIRIVKMSNKESEFSCSDFTGIGWNENILDKIKQDITEVFEDFSVQICMLPMADINSDIVGYITTTDELPTDICYGVVDAIAKDSAQKLTQIYQDMQEEELCDVTCTLTEFIKNSKPYNIEVNWTI